MKRELYIAIVMLCAPMMFGCYHANEFVYHDAAISMHEYEIVDLLQNKKGRKIKRNTVGNIKPSNMIYDPEEPKVIDDKIVSVNVTEDVPIVDVIMELSRMSDVDVQIDPTITGGVNLSLKNKPLRYVFNRICGLTDTRYDEKYGIVIFNRDIPYTKTYDIDFLDVNRETSSSITLNTSGLSSANSTVKGGGTSTVTMKSEDTFWSDMVKDIEQIIDTTENTNKLYTLITEKKQRIVKNEEAENKLREDIDNGIYNSMSSNSSNDSSSSKSDSSESLYASSFRNGRIRTNRRAGLLVVTASTKSHRLIEKYLQKLKRKATAQVLIEMRFLEINLNKKYQAGIDWNGIKLGKIGAFTSSIVSQSVGDAVMTPASITFNKSINAVASMFEMFGSTRTLSNPRINAVNNQTSFMTFATNYVYFLTEATYTPATFNNTVAITPAYRNVSTKPNVMPLGIIMSVTPAINLDKGEVMLNMKPTISKLETTITDPAVTILMDDQRSDKDRPEDQVLSTKSSIPIANVREFDTILKLKDSQTAVIGGFTERTTQATNKGVPFLRSIPIIGALFSWKDTETKATETIILVRATILDYGKEISEYELGIFDRMSDDPRFDYF